jgi:hypothetical protein
MPLFKEKASDSPQKCKSTFGSDALERNDHLPKQHAQPAGWRIRLRPGSSAAKVRFRTEAVPAIVGAFRIARDAAAPQLGHEDESLNSAIGRSTENGPHASQRYP